MGNGIILKASKVSALGFTYEWHPRERWRWGIQAEIQQWDVDSQQGNNPTYRGGFIEEVFEYSLDGRRTILGSLHFYSGEQSVGVGASARLRYNTDPLDTSVEGWYNQPWFFTGAALAVDLRRHRVDWRWTQRHRGRWEFTSRLSGEMIADGDFTDAGTVGYGLQFEARLGWAIWHQPGVSVGEGFRSKDLRDDRARTVRSQPYVNISYTQRDLDRYQAFILDKSLNYSFGWETRVRPTRSWSLFFDMSVGGDARRDFPADSGSQTIWGGSFGATWQPSRRHYCELSVVSFSDNPTRATLSSSQTWNFSWHWQY